LRSPALPKEKTHGARKNKLAKKRRKKGETKKSFEKPNSDGVKVSVNHLLTSH
jgi:hypothetical protein